MPLIPCTDIAGRLAEGTGGSVLWHLVRRRMAKDRNRREKGKKNHV